MFIIFNLEVTFREYKLFRNLEESFGWRKSKNNFNVNRNEDDGYMKFYFVTFLVPSLL